MKKMSLALVLMLLTSGIIAQEETIKQKFIEETRIEAPVFKGNQITEAAPQQSLNQYLQQQLSYLSNYDFISDEGIVSVEFTVESDGLVSNVFVANSVNELLDKSVLEAIEKSSKLWLAGKVNGIPNAMSKTVFVKFDIPGNISHNQMAIDCMTKAVRQVYAIENVQHLPLAMDKQTRKTSRKARIAESYLSKAERFKPNDLSITFWQAKVYELQGRNELMQQQLDKYLELVHYKQYEEDLLNQHDMAVITLK